MKFLFVLVLLGLSLEIYAGSLSAQPENKSNEEFAEAAKTKETRRAYVLKKFLSLSESCGLQHSNDDHSEGNNNAGIDEYPWLVHLEYQSPYLHPTPGTEFKCAGALISDRLVLTSHNCAGNVLLTQIKIGQYDKHNSTSCVTLKSGTKCTDPVIVTSGVRAEVPNSNLILIRLTKKVNFSDFVKPICLPFEELQRPKVGDTAYTSGWGEEDVTGSKVSIKKKVAHEIIAYKAGDNGDDISFGKGDSSSYVCEGDQGGPLMYAHKQEWYLAGIVVNTPCNRTTPPVANALTSSTMDNLIDPIFYFLSN